MTTVDAAIVESVDTIGIGGLGVGADPRCGTARGTATAIEIGIETATETGSGIAIGSAIETATGTGIETAIGTGIGTAIVIRIDVDKWKPANRDGRFVLWLTESNTPRVSPRREQQAVNCIGQAESHLPSDRATDRGGHGLLHRRPR